MPVTKQYLRYEPAAVFGLVASTRANVVLLDEKFRGMEHIRGRVCVAAANEKIFLWDLRKGEKIMQMGQHEKEITVVKESPDLRQVAVSYTDGAIDLFNVRLGQLEVTFHGHKSAVSALCFGRNGMVLASGGSDCDVVVWDVVNESGLCRLRGHKGAVTQVRFLPRMEILVSSSKDTYIKLWDLETQHCFVTLVGHVSAVWDFELYADGSRLVAGCSDSELRVWKIEARADGDGGGDDVAKAGGRTIGTSPEAKKRRLFDDEQDGDEQPDEQDETGPVVCTKLGSVVRKGLDRTLGLSLDGSGRFLLCYGVRSPLEIFRIFDEDEVAAHSRRRRKKARKRAADEGATGQLVEVDCSLQDEIRFVAMVKFVSSKRIRSAVSYLCAPGLLAVVALLNNGLIEQYSVRCDRNPKAVELLGHSSLKQPGHSSDVRCVGFSSDNTAVISGSADHLKVWNRDSLTCIRTMDCSHVLCAIFAPGDRHVIAGSKDGRLEIFDIALSERVEVIEAHAKSVWSAFMFPDGKGLCSVSGDQLVKFWSFEISLDVKGAKQLTIEHQRTLQMSEDVLCGCFSGNGKFLAVGLLDNTVKLFFVDTLKFFLSLYGHKLPIMSVDISSDSALLVSGSADRNIKIWGMDFGDCHRSLFAHDDCVMCVKFVPKTHLFFSAGKDGKIKQWDADNFLLIMTLSNHHAQIWSFDLSSNAKFLVSASHDKTLRLWEKTEEILVVNEEREKEQEKISDEAVKEEEEPVIAGETNKALPGKKTVETVKAADRIIEAIDFFTEQDGITGEQRKSYLAAYKVETKEEYVLENLARVKSAELEEALMLLPFSYCIQLLNLLAFFLRRQWQVELCCRCSFFLIKIHHGQVLASTSLAPVILDIRRHSAKSVQLLRDRIGFNRAGLEFLQKNLERNDEVTMFADATRHFRRKKKTRKKVILSVHT